MKIFNNDKARRERDELLKMAYYFFLAYQYDLSTGTIKETVGCMTITITFSINENKG